MKKTVSRKPVTRKKVTRKKKPSAWGRKIRAFVLVFAGLLLITGIAYHYRNGLAYYLGFKSDKRIRNEEAKRISDVRNFQVLSKYQDKVAGIDVSQYQSKIDWSRVRTIENTYSIQFALIRATVGKDNQDLQFENNWKGAKENNIIRGAYHYYRPNENSLKQANNFISLVKLRKGDLPPVLDIEQLPRKQSLDSLKVGLRRWLVKIENHYKVKPIIYTGEKYYNDFLKDEFGSYSFWIANYNFFVEDMQDDWLFWQFTEKATVEGIEGNVDVNLYNGTPKMLGYLTLSN